jgi:protein-S-isoprenylcysteine O-methyltransferase Ste14
MSRVPSLGPHGEGWVVLQFILFGAIAVAGFATGGAGSGSLPLLRLAVGLLLMCTGLALAGKGLLDLGRNLSPLPRPRTDAELVQTGVYRWVRHPIYGGLIALALGWALFVASLLTVLLALLLALLFELKSRREEAWLVEHYPGYQDYMDRTDRFFPLFH